MSPTETELRLIDRLSRLADYATAEPTRSLDARSVVLLDLEPVRRRSRVPATVAAAVVTFAVIGSVVVVAEGSDTGPRAGVTATSPSGQPLSFDHGSSPPDVELPGWTRIATGSSVVAPSVGNELRVILFDEGMKLDGPRIRIGVTSPPGSYSAGANATPVDVNGVAAEIGTQADGRVILTWSPAPDRVVYLDAVHATPDEVVKLARGLVFTTDLAAVTVNAAAIPNGLDVAKAGRVVTEDVVASEFKFERDGMLFQVNVYPGGRTTFEQRLDGDVRSVSVRGLSGALNTDDGKHFKLLLADGPWAVEIAGGPFVNEQAFLETVDNLVVTPSS
jgi:hypothetical protein